jgi:hypothetical protein
MPATTRQYTAVGRLVKSNARVRQTSYCESKATDCGKRAGRVHSLHLGWPDLRMGFNHRIMLNDTTLLRPRVRCRRQCRRMAGAALVAGIAAAVAVPEALRALREDAAAG